MTHPTRQQYPLQQHHQQQNVNYIQQRHMQPHCYQCIPPQPNQIAPQIAQIMQPQREQIMKPQREHIKQPQREHIMQPEHNQIVTPHQNQHTETVQTGNNEVLEHHKLLQTYQKNNQENLQAVAQQTEACMKRNMIEKERVTEEKNKHKQEQNYLHKREQQWLRHKTKKAGQGLLLPQHIPNQNAKSYEQDSQIQGPSSSSTPHTVIPHISPSVLPHKSCHVVSPTPLPVLETELTLSHLTSEMTALFNTQEEMMSTVNTAKFQHKIAPIMQYFIYKGNSITPDIRRETFKEIIHSSLV